MSSKLYSDIVNELSEILGALDPAGVDAVAEAIASAQGKIFCAGVGRSGYMMRAFSMRLMHCGFNSFFVGDTATPGASENDILVIGSGSGETGSLKAYAAKAKKLGLKIYTVTTSPDSELGKTSEICLHLKAISPKLSGNSNSITSVQPMGSLFEQGLLICLDGLVIKIMEKLGINSDEMFSRHANLE